MNQGQERDLEEFAAPGADPPLEGVVVETYSWAGTDRRGVAHTGRTGLPLAEVARITENYYRQGWRSLHVARGWEVPSAATPDLVAAIEPSADTGRRSWWTEIPTDREAGG